MAEFVPDISIFRNLERDIRVAVEADDRFEVRRLREELLNYFLRLRIKLNKKDPTQKLIKRHIRNLRELLEETNPSQLQIVPAPDPVPKIGSASYPDKCMICHDQVVGQGCRVNCDAGHIYHCGCINDWKNTPAGNEYVDTDWQNGCPLCRQKISQMYHVKIPEGFTTTTEFGRLIKRKSNNSGMSLKTIDRLIKLVQKM